MNTLKVTLNIQPPFLSNQQGALPFGTDAKSLHYNGKPVILGTLVKGNLREIMIQTAHPETQSWLGKDPQGKIENNTDEFSLLLFSYFWELQNPDDSQKIIRKRIKIDKHSETVGDGMLRFAEVIETHNDQALRFTGNIYLNPRKQTHEEPLATLKNHLERLFSAIPALGSNRGIGYGKLLDVNIEEQTHNHTTYLATTDKQTILQDKALDILIRPHWPICFPQPTTGNDLVSKDHIPGAAIKAILANNMVEHKNTLSEAFDQMRITHALYTHDSKNQKPAILPLSLAKANNTYHNLCLQKGITLINDTVPRFQPDWKASDYRQCPDTPPCPERHLQVRNQHSAEHHAARQEGLFSLESIKGDDNHHWRARINLPDTDTEPLLDAIIAACSDGLFPLGKTQAPASIDIKPATHATLPGSLGTDDLIIITLQSPAQLFAMTNEVKDTPLTQGKQALDTLYQHAWDALSDNSLAYSHSYSRQIIKGGEAWYKQFGKKTNLSYQPHIFIEKGSVFVLAINNPDTALEKLQHWQRFGLPLPESIPTDWQKTPWLPQNGYGEIKIDIQQGANQHD